MYTIYYRYKSIDKEIITPWAPATKASTFSLPCGYFNSKLEAEGHLLNTITDWPLVKNGNAKLSNWYVAIAHKEHPVFLPAWSYNLSALVKALSPDFFEVLT